MKTTKLLTFCHCAVKYSAYLYSDRVIYKEIASGLLWYTLNNVEDGLLLKSDFIFLKMCSIYIDVYTKQLTCMT